MDDPASFRTLIEKVKAETEAYKIKLPVSKSSLFDVFSKGALDLHYDVLYSNYVKKALAGEGDFQFAGAKLHTLFFEQFQESITPNSPTGAAKLFIEKHFGDYGTFKAGFTQKALEIQGSGWAYLSSNGAIKTIPNHKLVSDVVLIIDMWEHSYIIDYGSDKEEYLKKMWSIINWDIINARMN